MRNAILVIVLAMAAAPSQASKSCLSLAEARQQFGQAHLYWHGAGHCWDASAGRQGVIHRANQADAKQAEAAQDNSQDAGDKPNSPPTPARSPKWRDAMSEMLPADAPVFRSAPVSDAFEPTDASSSGPNWLDRWVDITQIFPRTAPVAATAPTATAAPPKAETPVTPIRVFLAFLAIVLTIAVIEILFRNAVNESRK
jgi:hypothetical protein